MIKIQGIILRKYDFGEADRIYSVYGEEGGKMDVLAKGARKIKSKLAGHVEPWSVSSLMIAPGKNIGHLAGASLVESFGGIKSDLGKIALADYCLSAVDQLTRPEKAEENIFPLLAEFLRALDASSSVSRSFLLAFAFVFCFLARLGYASELGHCLNRKKKIIPGQNFFSVDRGGLVCPSCHKENNSLELLISTNSIKVLRLFLRESLDFCGKIRLGKQDLEEVGRIVGDFLNYHLDRPLSLNSKFKVTMPAVIGA